VIGHRSLLRSHHREGWRRTRLVAAFDRAGRIPYSGRPPCPGEQVGRERQNKPSVLMPGEDGAKLIKNQESNDGGHVFRFGRIGHLGNVLWLRQSPQNHRLDANAQFSLVGADAHVSRNRYLVSNDLYHDPTIWFNTRNRDFS
jgi:hypothetical protein